MQSDYAQPASRYFGPDNISHEHQHDRIGILVSRWHAQITELLYNTSLETLHSYGVQSTVRYYVPGSFEMPLAAKYMASSQFFDAIICLGCVIKGETDHHHYINQAISEGLMRVSLEHRIPVIFGILTTDSVEQAQARADGTKGSKGAEAATAALEMIDLMRLTRVS